MGYIEESNSAIIGGTVAATISTARGKGTTNGDSLVIYPNANQTVPYIQLRGNDELILCVPASVAVKIYETTSHILSISHSGTDVKFESGGSVPTHDLYFATSGVVKFGTYTAGAATDSTGYITIKDAGGVSRKLMVQA